jgi:septal ring factor EnvC (AmiA/AmiB activator)
MLGRLVEQGTQTDWIEMKNDWIEQDRQLEAAHSEAGEKTRDLARAQDQIQALLKQLKMQTQMAEQYKEEVRTLEVQLEGVMAKQRRAEDACNLAESQLRKERDQSGSRPVSSAWIDESLGSRGEAKENLSQASTRSSFQARCWSANGRRQRPQTGEERATPETKFTPRGARTRDEPAFEESLSTSEDDDEAELNRLHPRLRK